jgi:hypothetical protein
VLVVGVSLDAAVGGLAGLGLLLFRWLERGGDACVRFSCFTLVVCVLLRECPSPSRQPGCDRILIVWLPMRLLLVEDSGHM